MADPLSLKFAALADPTRRALLSRLSAGEANVTQLAEPFLREMTLPAVTKHLKVLERAGLVTQTREARFRPRQINGEALKDVADWVEPYRALWEEQLDRLDEFLQANKAAKTPKS